MILKAMLVVLTLLVRPHMPGRSKVMTQTERGWVWGMRLTNLAPLKNFIIEKPNGCQMDNIGHMGEKD